MEKAENLNQAERKAKFKATLREFVRTVLFIALVGVGIGLFISFSGPQRGQWYIDAEKIENRQGSLQFRDKRQTFSGGQNQSDLQAKSGKYSLKLDSKEKYGFSTEIPSLSGTEKIEVSVWRLTSHSYGKQAGLVAEVAGIEWQMAKEGTKNEGEWELLQLNLEVDCRSSGKVLKIYCWNPGEREVFFDDLEVRIR